MYSAKEVMGFACKHRKLTETFSLGSPQPVRGKHSVPHKYISDGSKVLTAVTITTVAFGVMTPYGLEGGYECFGETKVQATRCSETLVTSYKTTLRQKTQGHCRHMSEAYYAGTFLGSIPELPLHIDFVNSARHVLIIQEPSIK
jgi:hypothetical protein